MMTAPERTVMRRIARKRMRNRLSRRLPRTDEDAVRGSGGRGTSRPVNCKGVPQIRLWRRPPRHIRSVQGPQPEVRERDGRHAEHEDAYVAVVAHAPQREPEDQHGDHQLHGDAGVGSRQGDVTHGTGGRC